LAVLAFIMNAEVCKRLWTLKDKLDYWFLFSVFISIHNGQWSDAVTFLSI
jgi:hypothetical protein